MKAHRMLPMAMVIGLAAVSPQVLAADGAQLFNRSCAACHQEDGSGVETMAPPLRKDTFKRLGEQAPKYIAYMMLTGMAGVSLDGANYFAAMPEFSSLSDQDIADIGTHVLVNLNHTDAKLTPEMVAQWRSAPLSPEAIHRIRGD